MKKYVWEFTNQKKLTKSEFLSYFERKVFRTIRKYEMLPLDRKIKLRKSESLNFNVLKYLLGKKFVIIEVSKGENFLCENLSDVAEQIFANVLKGNFSTKLFKPEDNPFRPLYFLSDKEVELYGRLLGIKGKCSKRDKNIQSLFEKFLNKNPDLEHNVVNAFAQLSLV